MNIEESQKLIETLLDLRKKADNTKNVSDIKQYKQYEQICMNKFKYLILMKTHKYKKFTNYDDLVQDGLEALIKAIKTYNPTKGIFFLVGA